MRRTSLVFVISGPSGAGKTTLGQHLLQTSTEMTFSVSATTRKKRGKEANARDYHYLSREEFQARLAADDFLEHAEVHGELYGTLEAEVQESLQAGKSILLDIDVQGGLRIKEKMPDAVLVFVLPPSMQELERRLRARKTDDPETIERRLANAPEEIRMLKDYDYVVVNEKLETAQKELRAIFNGEELKSHRLPGGAERFVTRFIEETH